MMQVTVHWFAAYREATGTESETVETTAASARELFAEMESRHPKLTAFRTALVAINDDITDWASPVRAGDRVLFFPPVAGG